MNIVKTCLDCEFADWGESCCGWNDAAKTPHWVKVELASGDGGICRERPYVDCPVWKLKEKP